MSAFYIKIFDKVKYNEDGFEYYLGEAKFNEDIDKLILTVDYWSLGEYVDQWIQGLERIKTHSESCLVATIDSSPMVLFFALFKENNKIFIQQQLMVSKKDEELLQATPFTLESCYKFIKPRFSHPESDIVLEYTISVDDVDPALTQLKAYKLKLKNKK